MNNNHLVLRDADYIIQDANTIKKGQSILIKDNRVIEVAPYTELRSEYNIDRVRDCTGEIILPGLINTHTHIHETMMRARKMGVVIGLPSYYHVRSRGSIGRV